MKRKVTATAFAKKSGRKETKASRAKGTDPSRVRAILAKLDQAYPNVTSALTHRNAFELLIATILSAQSTDVGVNKVTKTLFQKYPTPEALAYANPAEIEKEIRSTGFYRNKTKSIIGASKMQHLEDAVKALDLKLTDEELRALAEPYRPHPVLGHS